MPEPAPAVTAELPRLLPLSEWEPTKTTLHLWTQIVGKMRLALAPRRNHWWHVPLYVDVRGLTTRRLRVDGITFQVDFDFIDHRLRVLRADGEESSFPLCDGFSVADFDRELHSHLDRLGVDVAIRERPFGVPTTTPFPDDREHASYDSEAAADFWRALDWTDAVFEEFAGRFTGKTSPIHLFWHSFDLAFSRYSGTSAPPLLAADAITREAYSHEVIAFGFWAGDELLREPAFYSYTSPEPAGLRSAPLRPRAARWVERGNGSLALLPYEAVRASSDAHACLLAFLESAYDGGARAAGWSIDELKARCQAY